MKSFLGKGAFALAIAALAMQAGTASACQYHKFPGDYVHLRKSLFGDTKSDRVGALVQAAIEENKDAVSLNRPPSPFPPGTVIDKIEYPQADANGDPEHVQVYLRFPEEFFLTNELTAYRVAAMGKEFIAALMEENISGYFLRIWDPSLNQYLSPDEIAPPEEMPKWIPPVDEVSVAMSKAQGKDPFPKYSESKSLPVINPGQPVGSLSNKTIFMNQSHGWFDDVDFGRFRVQRGNTCNTLEDFGSAEFLNLYVLQMLRNGGAKVMTVREPDHQTNMVIVDNSDTAAGLANGRYVETGTWANSGLNGFVQKTTAQWTGKTINPFNQGAGQNRLSSSVTTGAPTATATWTSTIPANGYYNVYASWTGFAARANDAQYLVHHSGGISEIRMNQKIDGYTWVLLGNWYFEANAPENERKVVLTNSSQDTTATNVSADAVRWGGGMGDIARQTVGRISNRPRWEEEAVHYLQYTGFGYSGTLHTGVDDEEGGWSDRPQYARWEHSQKDASVEDAVYFAWHTNAFNGTTGACSGTATGLTTFRHVTNTSAASITLQTTLHDKMYNAANTLWFGGGWTARIKNEDNFGEVNQTSLGANLPGVLIEGLFHDGMPDGLDYNEPRFRMIMARAITQGLIDFFNAKDGTSRPYPPEIPLNFRAELGGGTTATLSWSAGAAGGFNGAAATSYRVFRSKNGFGFDDGVTVAGTSTTIANLVPGDTTYFRVAAQNAGGQSFPTETLVVCSASGASVLVVNGFDRNQRSQIPVVAITNAGSAITRHDPRTFQGFNYVVEHGEALQPLGLRVSSTCNERVADGTVNLASYDVVVWIAGEESTTDEVLTANEQTRLQAYLGLPGKNLFFSGAEVGWDLGRAGVSSAGDVAFFNGFMRTAYVGDSAGTYTVNGTAGGPFAGLTSIVFSTASGARYNAETPDTYGVSNGSSIAMTYSTGTTAAVAYGGPAKVLSFGFPFETIGSAPQRAQVMAAALTFFAPTSSAAQWVLF